MCIRRMRWVVAALGPPSIGLKNTVPTAVHTRSLAPKQASVCHRLTTSLLHTMAHSLTAFPD